MSGHLFLHIGPPKTATTSLQYALQEHDGAGLAYLGIYPPRRQGKRGIASTLYAQAAGRLDPESDEVRSSVAQIAEMVRGGKTAVLSEEMFLVWQEDLPFWDKLDRLERAISNIPHTYLLTLRAPGEVLPSYYQELYHRLPAVQKLSADRFFTHERCDCYDYRRIADWLETRGCQVRFIDFREIGPGELTFRKLFGPACTVTGSIALRRENVGRKADTSSMRELPAVDLSQALAIGPLRTIGRSLKRQAPKLTGMLRNALSRLVIRRSGLQTIEVPEGRLAALNASYDAMLQRTCQARHDSEAGAR